jgi:hypothetical protein
MPNWTDEEDLRFTIEMALLKIKVAAKRDRDEVYRRMVAQKIVDHLKLSNWRFVKGQPAPPYGQPRKVQV